MTDYCLNKISEGQTNIIKVYAYFYCKKTFHFLIYDNKE